MNISLLGPPFFKFSQKWRSQMPKFRQLSNFLRKMNTQLFVHFIPDRNQHANLNTNLKATDRDHSCDFQLFSEEVI